MKCRDSVSAGKVACQAFANGVKGILTGTDFNGEESTMPYLQIFSAIPLMKAANTLAEPIANYLFISTATKVAAKVVVNLIPEGKLANHLFKGAGKLADNPANRILIQNIANGKALVVDAFGKSWYRGVDAAGKGIYSYTQNGIVKGAGYTNLSAAEIIAKYGVK